MKRRSVRAAQPGLLSAIVAAELAVSDAEAAALVTRGAVYLNGKRTQRPDAPVQAGQVVMIVLEESGRETTAAPSRGPALSVLYEDDDVLAVDKPAGITAQPTPGRAGESLVDLATEYLGRDAGLVHRLDRQTSGVTIFGKHPEATSALAAEFRHGRAKKRYLAVVTAPLPERGEIDLPLSRDPSRVGRWRASRTANGIPALTRFERLHESPEFSLVALYPQTGRTHQLRAHLTALGAPIAGDALYEGASSAGAITAPRCLLHAQGLMLAHPGSGEPLLIEAPAPDDLRRFFEHASVAVPSGRWPDSATASGQG